MNAEAIVSVSAAVVALTQLAKWSKLPDQYGPLAVLVLSALGVGMWGYSVGTFERTQIFGYFAGWIAVSTSAAGVFGFTRAAPASVVDANRNSLLPGAAQSPTEKPHMHERRDR